MLILKIEKSSTKLELVMDDTTYYVYTLHSHSYFSGPISALSKCMYHPYSVLRILYRRIISYDMKLYSVHTL